MNTHPYLAKAHPRHHLYAAIGDLLLAIPAACVWQGVLKLEAEFWSLVPAWVWPTLTLLLVASSLHSYLRHRRAPAREA